MRSYFSLFKCIISESFHCFWCFPNQIFHFLLDILHFVYAVLQRLQNFIHYSIWGFHSHQRIINSHVSQENLLLLHFSIKYVILLLHQKEMFIWHFSCSRHVVGHLLQALGSSTAVALISQLIISPFINHFIFSS